MSATGSVREATLSPTCRGTTVEGHSRPRARVESIVGADQTAAVVDTMLKNGGERSFVFVIPVEEPQPAESVRTGEMVAEAG